MSRSVWRDLTAVVDIDIVPVREGAGDLGVRLAVGLREVVQGRVGEDHAESEGVVGTVPLHHGDVVRGIGLLEEDRQVEAGRSRTDGDDLHGSDCTSARRLTGHRECLPGARDSATVAGKHR
jgi:hypothetical protein